MPRKTLKQRAERDAAKAREQDSFGFNAAADAEDNRVRQRHLVNHTINIH